MDSLRRHVNELHKSIRPYACSLCEKSYGRRDYLDRHMRNKHQSLYHIDDETKKKILDVVSTKEAQLIQSAE